MSFSRNLILLLLFFLGYHVTGSSRKLYDTELDAMSPLPPLKKKDFYHDDSKVKSNGDEQEQQFYEDFGGEKQKRKKYYYAIKTADKGHHDQPEDDIQVKTESKPIGSIMAYGERAKSIPFHPYYDPEDEPASRSPIRYSERDSSSSLFTYSGPNRESEREQENYDGRSISYTRIPTVRTEPAFVGSRVVIEIPTPPPPPASPPVAIRYKEIIRDLPVMSYPDLPPERDNSYEIVKFVKSTPYSRVQVLPVQTQPSYSRSKVLVEVSPPQIADTPKRTYGRPPPPQQETPTVSGNPDREIGANANGISINLSGANYNSLNINNCCPPIQPPPPQNQPLVFSQSSPLLVQNPALSFNGGFIQPPPPQQQPFQFQTMASPVPWFGGQPPPPPSAAPSHGKKFNRHHKKFLHDWQQGQLPSFFRRRKKSKFFPSPKMDQSPWKPVTRFVRSGESSSSDNSLPQSFTIPILGSGSESVSKDSDLDLAVPGYAVLDSDFVLLDEFKGTDEDYKAIIEASFMSTPTLGGDLIEETTAKSIPVMSLVSVGQSEDTLNQFQANKLDSQSSSSPLYDNTKNELVHDPNGGYASGYKDFIPVLRFSHDIRPEEGAYSVKFSTANGIKSKELGYMKRVDDKVNDDHNGYGYTAEENGWAHVKEGSVSWLSPEGVRISLSYTADETGYHPRWTQTFPQESQGREDTDDPADDEKLSLLFPSSLIQPTPSKVAPQVTYESVNYEQLSPPPSQS